ncbi:potassium channel, subfamily K, member 7 [Amia ocellicauda]|uniref:potassium channel, subfamily K, member 7 n=1 Tax=Amia ocellicauda TaxID=2972642 RepID=UPI003464DEC8
MARNLDSVRNLLKARAFCFLWLGYVLYVSLGALVFMALERPEERALRAEVRALRRGFLRGHQCVRERRLDALLEESLSAGKRGVSVLDAKSQEYNYDFTSALFFVTTFLTTTGYGNTVPLSDEGKLFCIMYCLVGIPLTLLLLACLTQRLLPWVTHRPLQYARAHWGVAPARLALYHALALATLISALFFLLPAVAYSCLEPDWSFLEALYFCFISLSTVGLGDFLPGRTHGQAAKQAFEFATSCYLVLGLLAMLLLLETVWELPQMQAVMRLLSIPLPSQQGRLTVLPLDERIFTEDPLPPTTAEDTSPAHELQYTLPTATITPEQP